MPPSIPVNGSSAALLATVSLLLLRIPLCLPQRTSPDVLVHTPVDLDDNWRSFTQEPGKEPLHDAVAPVRSTCECNVLCTARPAQLAQSRLDELLGVGYKSRRLADLRHSSGDEMRLDALDVDTMGLEFGAKR